MRKGIVLLVMMCALGLKGQAQIYGYDQAIKLPTAELYDMNVMNAYANALRETAGTRMQAYRMYCDYAITALSEKQWNSAIYYVDKALDTGYYSGDLYWIRGFANEQMGNLKQAKKDYKEGTKLGSEGAEQALEQLKERMKRK